MPDTDVTEKTETDAKAAVPTDSLTAQSGGTDAPSADGEVAGSTVAEKKVSAPEKPSREEQLERELRASRGDQSRMAKEIKALRAQIAAGDPEARKTAREAFVQAARLSATDPDAAERAIRAEHKADDERLTRQQQEAQLNELREAARIEMGEALTEAGLSAEKDWTDPRNKELRAIRLQWITAVNIGDSALASQLANEVRTLKKPEAEPTPKTRAQRVAELALADTGARGGGAEGLASYRKRLQEGKQPPSAEEIDRITAHYVRG